MKHVLNDADPGVDDALTLLLAFSSPELRVEGLTTVAGNVSLDLGSLNALILLDFLGVEDVSVVTGAEKPPSCASAGTHPASTERRASEEPRCPSQRVAWMSGAP